MRKMKITMTPEEVIAQNRHKVEKGRRRKQYHDSQVQGTNNSSIVSKRSVEMIYNPIVEPNASEWFKLFVPKAKRRSPAINRGYWIRMESIKQMVQRILDFYPDQPIRVVNLGCGFDPLPFQILETSARFHFYDFDYPELVQRKLAMIKESKEILAVIGQEGEVKERSAGVVLQTNNYTLVGCDLKNTELYKQQVSTLLRGEGATIFIAEVLLAYMKPEHANPVVEILAQIPRSHFVVLEQIMPSGESHFFAQNMLYHFNHLRSPLQCVETYPTKQKQVERFKHYYPQAEIRDLFESWQQLISRDQKELVLRVEDFDEWEEFIVFCQHYVIIHSTNSGHMVFGETPEAKELPVTENVELEVLETELELKFPAACLSSEGKLMIHGGGWQSRSDKFLVADNNKLIEMDGPLPSARMCHTLTNTQNGYLVLTGGRGRPGVHLEDVWVFCESTKVWKLEGSIPGMSRHSALCIAPGTVLLFGNGRFFTVSAGEAVTVNEVPVTGSIPHLRSCGMVYDAEAGKGYIVGGISDEIEPTFNSTVYLFSVGSSIVVEPYFTSQNVARIGCMAIMQGDDLCVVGGVSAKAQGQNDTIVHVSACKTVSGVKISDDVWKTEPVFIGSQLAGNTIVGGGAVCYSFGSSYSKVYRIR